MKKYFKVLFLGVALFVLSGVANAQMKIAYVNSAEILESMPESAKVKTNLEAYYNELQAQLQTMLTEYSNKVQDYEANQASLSNLVKQSKEKEIVDMENRIQQFRANAEEEMVKKQEELLKPVLDKVQNAINAVGKEKGYTYNIDNAGGTIVYLGADAIDASKDVKAKLSVKK
jgi:outer membrane protein